MGILKSTKPAWEHKDPAIRLTAAKQLDETEQGIITTIAQNDSDEKVRLAAIKKIADPQVLEDIKKQPQINKTLLNAVNNRLQTLVYDTVLSSEEEIQIEALQHLDDEHLLADLAIKVNNQAVRLQAVSEINNQETLCKLIERQCGKITALAALDKINDAHLLERLSSHASNKSVRIAAQERLLQLTSDKNCIQQAPQQTALQDLLKEAESIAANTPLNFEGSPFATLENKWQEIDPDDLYALKNSLDSIMEKYTSLADDFLMEQANNQQSHKQEKHIKEEAEQLCISIESLVGSTTADTEKVTLEIIKKWQKLTEENQVFFSSKTSPADKLQERFDKACRDFNKTLKKIYKERETLSALDAECARLNQLLEKGQPSQGSLLLGKLEKKVLETTFQFLERKAIDKRLSKFNGKIIELQEAEKEAQQKKLQKQQQICEQIELLNKEVHNRKIAQQIKKLQTSWKSLSPLPQSISQEINDRYNNAIHVFDEHQQIRKVEDEWKQWINKNKKEELCRSAEALDNESDLEIVEKTIKELQNIWKGSGAIYGKVSQSLWQRFQNACNRNYQRCQPFLEERRRKQQEMLNRKEEICKEAEQLADSSSWQKTAATLKALQAEWKSLDSRQNRGKERRLYHRFRKSCNHFFDRRSADFKEHDQERRKSLSTKEDLCIQAEAMADEPQLKYGREFRNLQEQWKKAGPAPRNQEEKIWKRFRATCDKYFDWLETQRQENALEKQNLCKEAQEICKNLDSGEKLGESTEALEKIKNRWKQLGPVPREQEKILQKELQKSLDIFYAFRQECHAARDRQWQDNLAKKEALVERAEQIASAASSPEAAAELKDLQNQWKTIGSAPREYEKTLFRSFQTAGNAYFDGRRLEVEEYQHQRLENQRKKERLIFELENIIGMGHSSETDKAKVSTLSLAEELKIALESNVFMAGKRDDRQSQQGEVKRIQQEWKKTGPTNRKQEQKLWERYKAALDFFYADDGRKRPPGKNK